LRREKDTPSIYDAQSEAVRMIQIVMLLLQHIRDPQNNMHYITREDIIDVFYNNKNNNVNQKNLNKLSLYSEARIQTRLRPQKVGMYLLDWLITEEIIYQFIELRRFIRIPQY
jgi:hypothetical protein